MGDLAAALMRGGSMPVLAARSVLDALEARKKKGPTPPRLRWCPPDRPRHLTSTPRRRRRRRRVCQSQRRRHGRRRAAHLPPGMRQSMGAALAPTSVASPRSRVLGRV